MLVSRIPSWLRTAAAVFAAAAGCVALARFWELASARSDYPLDLEWMEGGLLVHALRLRDGLDIYVKPSAEFVPYLYTPLYPLTLAWLGRLFPIGYTLGRTVSIAAFLATLGVGAVVAVQPVWRSRELRALREPALTLAPIVAAAGAVSASFVFTGSFYDLVRSDSLMLFFVMLAAALAYAGKDWRSAALAGAAIAAAFFTKQTASLMGLAIGAALLAVDRRRALIYCAVAGVTLACSLGYWQYQSHGWFWTYVFKLHQSHLFDRRDAFVKTPGLLAHFAWPIYVALGLASFGLALERRLERRDLVLFAIALAGFIASCIGHGTQWAWINAYIPAIVFPAAAAGILVARLFAGDAARWATTGLAALAALCLGYAAVKDGAPDKRSLVPSHDDRRAAQRLLDTLRSFRGDGFIPCHPFYGVLAGKQAHVHNMGIMDVNAQFGRLDDLGAAIAATKFDFIVLDSTRLAAQYPEITTHYAPVQDLRYGFDSVPMFAGTQLWPSLIYLPLRSAPLPAGARMLFDAEGGTWNGWQTEGTAFGTAPAALPVEALGRYAISSRVGGPAAMGTLRSPTIVLGGTGLRFWLDGPADERLRVKLVAKDKTLRSVTPAGPAWIEWSLGDVIGESAQLVIEDASDSAGLVVDDIMTLGLPSEVGFAQGFALQQAGRLDDAISVYRKFLLLDPGHVQARFNLAHALMTNHQCAAAVGEFQRVLEIDPARASARAHLANCSQLLGTGTGTLAQAQQAARNKHPKPLVR